MNAMKKRTELIGALVRSVPSFDLELLAPLGRAAPSFVCCRYRAAYGLLGRQKNFNREP